TDARQGQLHDHVGGRQQRRGRVHQVGDPGDGPLHRGCLPHDDVISASTPRLGCRRAEMTTGRMVSSARNGHIGHMLIRPSPGAVSPPAYEPAADSWGGPGVWWILAGQFAVVIVLLVVLLV